MSELTQNTTIPKNVATGNDLDYAFLRQKGQEYIERLAGNLWTDYNEHDPGITTLEMLCYAITDLGARIEMPLENILTPPAGQGSVEDQFFKAIEILPSKPVTEADYRKLFIDLAGVKNCWLKRFEKTVYVDCKHDKLSYDKADFAGLENHNLNSFILNGLYRILVDFDEQVLEKAEDKEAKKEEIKQAITSVYHKNRNLCEDLVTVDEVKTYRVQVCASIELYPEVDEEKVHAQVLRAIDKYFSPDLWFYSLQQMFEKGYTTDQIFEGPLLANGFIDPEELEKARLRKEVRLSDLMQLIMNIEGVKVIREMSINDCTSPVEDKDVWLVCIPEDMKPVRCHLSAFSYYKSVLPVNVNSKVVKAYLEQFETEEQARQAEAGVGMDIPVPRGVYLQTGETTTIQNDFPETYGIGLVGLPTRASVERRSQAKQLKAYLLFFDQIIAGYFAHLSKVKDLLSVDQSLSETYFTQVVKDIQGFDELVSTYPSDDKQLTSLLLSELDDHITRKNQLLDHLLARFAEKFSQYAFLMKTLYGKFSDQSVVDAKQLFLSEYGEIVAKDGQILNKGISNWRGSAFNYFGREPEDLWDTENVAGAQKRIARLCGLKDYSRRNLSESSVEVYDLIDSDGKKVYRWRILNRDGVHVLSATVNYHTPKLAEQEMYFAILKVIETSPETINAGFEVEIPDEAEIGNFEIQKAESGKFSFDVINTEADPDSTDRIIARQYLYYDTQEELKQAILGLIGFLRNDFTEEGMFMVEHILLRPDVTGEAGRMDEFMPVCTDNCENCEPIDPYSYRVTVVLPGWTYRFGNMDFRSFMEELIRRELPAHVLARICWIGDRKGKVADDKNDMLNLEKDWKAFLLARTSLGQAQDKSTLTKLIKTLTELNTIYPTGRLIDCDDESDELKGRIILGRTNIGNL